MIEISSFITNDQSSLADIIKNLSSKVENCYFLVGYFYFSGFSEIYKELKDKNLKILVGMDIEKEMGTLFKEVYRLEHEYSSHSMLKQRFYESLVEFVNNSDYFESVKNQEAFRIFLEKIQNGTLEVRKTMEPTHAKMYIFEFSDSEKIALATPGFVVVGSSNLTYSGLRGQNEINAILRDPAYFRDAKKIFDDLWSNSVPVIDENTLDEFEEKVLKKIWIDKVPDPYLLYIRVLHEYFESVKMKMEYLPSQITSNKFYDLKYQIDAIERALAILKQHNGVIIADVVGLGKSIIASTIAHVLRMKTVIIAPPHLRENWEMYIMEFDFAGRFFSSGKLEEALRFVERDNDEKLIIVDEAHRYRNENTETYSLLHRICQGNKIILLSATPFNNAPSDILSMLKLFQIPAQPTIKQWGNLQTLFHEFQAEFRRAKNSQDYDKLKKISDEIRYIISPLVIRRTRLDLMNIKEYSSDLKAQGISFPEVQDPVILNYDLGDLKDLYLETLEKIAPINSERSDYFMATRYKPITYIKNIKSYRERLAEFFGTEDFEIIQQNISEFMRKLLVFRFESSMYAFRKSLESMIRATEIMIRWYNLGKVPIYKRGGIVDPEQIFDSDEFKDDEELMNSEVFIEKVQELENKGYFFIDSREIKKGFQEDLEKDLKVLKKIYTDWFGEGKKLKDPKLEHFKEHLATLLAENSNRKMVVFSQYADTVDYLYNQLKSEFRVIRYTSKNANKSCQKIIREEFDASAFDQGNNYQILLATDAISEGFNLNRADVIINYDIPYNPMRVVQRIGRLNRIGKRVHDKIYIYNYFPTSIGESETSLGKVATAKIHMFNYLFGSDTKTLTSEEELISYFMEEYRKNESDSLSWDVKYLNELNEVKTYKSDIYKKALELPERVRVKIKNSGREGAIFFIKRNGMYSFEYTKDENTCETLTPEDGLKIFKEMTRKESEKTDEYLEKLYNVLTAKSLIGTDRTKLEGYQKKFIEYINYYIDYFVKDKEVISYLESLREATKYSALPEHLIRQGRKILSIHDKPTKEVILKKIHELKKLIPHEYVQGILRGVSKMTNADRMIILIEEFENETQRYKR
ncbi:MAG: helicase [Thermotogae bacterium]|nr:helicase [Thermotogota bacterium]